MRDLARMARVTCRVAWRAACPAASLELGSLPSSASPRPPPSQAQGPELDERSGRFQATRSACSEAPGGRESPLEAPRRPPLRAQVPGASALELSFPRLELAEGYRLRITHDPAGELSVTKPCASRCDGGPGARARLRRGALAWPLIVMPVMWTPDRLVSTPSMQTWSRHSSSVFGE